jgi:tRNA (mo5U34)-methyltransferase
VLRRVRKRRAVRQVGFWWHSIDLGDGVITPGVKDHDLLAAEWEALDLPDLRGKTVLDIGGWDGYFAFEAERRGAAKTAVLDAYVWSLDLPAQQAYWRDCQAAGVEPEPYESTAFWQPETLPGKAGFDAARGVLGSRVEPIVRDFAHDDLADLGTWDVVLFLGVLYHLHDPFDALKRLYAVTRELAVIETYATVVQGHEDMPLWQFIPGAEVNADSSNWWAPTLPGLKAMLTAAGFRSVAVKRGPSESAGGYRAVVQAFA